MDKNKIEMLIKGLLPVIIPVIAIVIFGMGTVLIQAADALIAMSYDLGYRFGSLIERMFG